MINWKLKDVDTLENQGKWNEAKSILIKLCKDNPLEPKYFIRLGFLCWYLLVEGHTLDGERVNSKELVITLEEVTSFGLENFNDNENFLWCFGYMIFQFPYYFGDYDSWEKKGCKMLERAYRLSPNDPIFKYSYLSSFPNTFKKFTVELLNVQAVLDYRFQGTGLLSQYFKDIWS